MPTACYNHEAIAVLLALSLSFPSNWMKKKKYSNKKNREREKAAKKQYKRREEKKEEKIARKVTKKRKVLCYNWKMHIYTLHDRNKFESSFFFYLKRNIGK